MKTQERRMEHCISAFLFYGLISFGLKSSAFAYSSLSPWQNEAGPKTGLILEPTAGFQAVDGESLELGLGLKAAISSDWNIYGKVSLESDPRLGINDRFFKNENFEWSTEWEVHENQNSVLGFTGGFFVNFPLHLGFFPFTTEIGLGLSTAPSTGALFIPGNLTLRHEPEKSGWIYGLGFSGESAISSAPSWISFRGIFGFQNSNGIRYGVELGLPATEINSENVSSILVHLQIPFGSASSQESDTPKPAPEISADPNPQYDLNAKVISMNESLFLIKIDRGSSDSIAKGQTFDIFSGENRMARAQVIAVKKDEAALNVIEYNQEYWIELGFSARRLSRGME